MKEKPTGLELLRAPFEKHQISKLPKPYKSDSPKGKCHECGGYHGLPAVHLDYVGHAALTDRLLTVDIHWNWEPLAFADGLPKFDTSGGLWIKLTVCGVTRLGYGQAEDSNYKDIGAREKEVIGDALRNAAMRFGAALDLWHKGDLHLEEKEIKKESEPGEFIIPIGKKYKGLKLKDITPEELNSFMAWIEVESRKSDQDPKGATLEFLIEGKKYLNYIAPKTIDAADLLS